MQGRFLYLSHLLYGICVKIFIMNRYILKSYTTSSLRSWRYCVGARLKFWRRSRVPKKGSRDEAVFLAARSTISESEYMTTAPQPNLTRLLHNTASYAGYTTSKNTIDRQYIMLRFNFVPGLNFIFFCFGVW